MRHARATGTRSPTSASAPRMRRPGAARAMESRARARARAPPTVLNRSALRARSRPPGAPKAPQTHGMADARWRAARPNAHRARARPHASVPLAQTRTRAKPQGRAACACVRNAHPSARDACVRNAHPGARATGGAPDAPPNDRGGGRRWENRRWCRSCARPAPRRRTRRRCPTRTAAEAAPAVGRRNLRGPCRNTWRQACKLTCRYRHVTSRAHDGAYVALAPFFQWRAIAKQCRRTVRHRNRGGRPRQSGRTRRGRGRDHAPHRGPQCWRNRAPSPSGNRGPPAPIMARAHHRGAGH